MSWPVIAVAADGTVPGAFAAAVTRALSDVDAHRRSGAEIAPWQATAAARDEQRREVAAAHASGEMVQTVLEDVTE